MPTDLSNMTGVTAKVEVKATATKKTNLTVPSDALTAAKALSLAFGSGAGAVNQMWHDRRTLAPAASEELDLSGVLNHAFGNAVSFAQVKLIAIFNRSDQDLDGHTKTDADIDVGGASANEFRGPLVAAGDRLNIGAGGMFLIAKPDATGWPVVAGTGDLLRIENKDASEEAVYDIVLLGESA